MRGWSATKSDVPVPRSSRRSVFPAPSMAAYGKASSFRHRLRCHQCACLCRVLMGLQSRVSSWCNWWTRVATHPHSGQRKHPACLCVCVCLSLYLSFATGYWCVLIGRVLLVSGCRGVNRQDRRLLSHHRAAPLRLRLRLCSARRRVHRKERHSRWGGARARPTGRAYALPVRTLFFHFSPPPATFFLFSLCLFCQLHRAIG